MKKTYLQPWAKVKETEQSEMICTSGVTSAGKGIGYGGVDTQGGGDPSSRIYNSLWDDEGEEDF